MSGKKKTAPRKGGGTAAVRELIPAAAVLVLLAAMLAVLHTEMKKSSVFPAAVTVYRPMLESCAKKEGISAYVEDLMAVMMVESNGELKDVMQSSESAGLKPDTLDTEASIAQGCAYFASILASAKDNYLDRLSVYQAYNYGKGYLFYVAQNGGVHTRELAEEFAKQQSGGKKVDYSNPVAVGANGGWRYAYGNMFYAELVDGIMQERRKEMELSLFSRASYRSFP